MKRDTQDSQPGQADRRREKYVRKTDPDRKPRKGRK